LRQHSNTNEKNDEKNDVKYDMSDMGKLLVEIKNMRKELDEMKEKHRDHVNKIDGIWSCIFIIYGLLLLSTIKKH